MLASIPTLWRHLRNACAERYVAAVLLLFTAVLMSARIADPDLWGHVQYGWDAMETGVPATTTYSYVAVQEPWINHELVAEWLLAVVCGLGGGVALLVMKSCLGAVVVGLLIWSARQRGVGWGVTTVVVLGVAACLANHWLCRPHLFSYVAFTGLLLMLDGCCSWERASPMFARIGVESPEPANRGRSRGLLSVNLGNVLPWLLPLLMVVWTNTHGGFLAGLAVLTAYAGARSLEIWRSGAPNRRDQLTRWWLLVGVCYLATLCNPYGWRFHAWLFHDLRVPRPEITEWRPPDLWEHWAFSLLVGMWFAALAMARRLPSLTTTIVLPLILWQSLSHSRHTAFFAIATGLWLPQYLAQAIRVGHGPWLRLANSLRGNAGIRLATTLLLSLAGIYSAWALSYQLQGILVERASYPVSAMRYLAGNNLHGRMVCAFNWAQYVLAARGERDASRPDGAIHGVLVQVDGRCRTAYTQRQLDQHFDFLLGEPGPAQRYRDPASGLYDPSAVLRDGNPELVLISRELRPSVRVMEQHQHEWCLLYQDSLAQLWGRRSVYDDPRSPSYLAPDRREITEELQSGYCWWPAIP